MLNVELRSAKELSASAREGSSGFAFGGKRAYLSRGQFSILNSPLSIQHSGLTSVEQGLWSNEARLEPTMPAFRVQKDTRSVTTPASRSLALSPAMFRTLWTIVVSVLVTFPIAAAVALIAMVNSTSPMVDRLIRFWARAIVRAAGIDLRTENMEAIQPDLRYVLVSNHHSYLDIPCVLAGVPQQSIRFLAKVSLFKVPIFGWGLRRAGFIPIDRKNRRTAVKSFELAAERIRKGNTIVVFPEEGRSRDLDMKPFQRGAFLLAMKSGLPVLPIALDGTFEVLKVGAMRITPGVVTIRAGAPIDTTGMSVRQKGEVALMARQQIGAMLFGPEYRAEAAAATDEG